MATTKQQALEKVIDPVVTGMGFEYLGCELVAQGRFSLLRVYVDKENGVRIDECAEISHQLNGVLNVEEVLPSNYHLEVSSPGLNRPLFKLSHYIKAIGKEIHVRLTVPVNEQRNFTGMLKAVIDEQVVLEIEGREVMFPYAAISKANVVYEFNKSMRQRHE